MTAPPSRSHPVGLLQVANRLVAVQADLGDPALQAWFDAVVDALAHAVVDLADGASAPVVEAAPPGRGNGGDLGPRTRGDAASCSAAAAELHAVLRGVRAVVVPVTAASFADQVEQTLQALVHGLQRYAQDVRAAGAAGPAPADRQRLLRVLRPALSAASSPGTTVCP